MLMTKTSSCFSQFFYRVNPNRTMEAICAYCFVASDSSPNKLALQSWETAHRCSHWLEQTA